MDGPHENTILQSPRGLSRLFLIFPSGFYPQSKPKDSDKEGTSNSTSEDGPVDGFTILSSKSLVLGQKLLETSHSSKLILEIQPRRTGTVFSNGADNLTSWLPAFILSVFARDKLSCRIENLS